MKNIKIIGFGEGDIKTLTLGGLTAIKNAEQIIASERIFDVLPKELLEGKEHFCESSPQKIIELINSSQRDELAILVSGDTGFFSLARVIRSMENKILSSHTLELVPGISSFSYFLNKLQISYEDCRHISLHGRSQSILSSVIHSKKLFGITSGNDDLKYIHKVLTRNGYGELEIFIGENLSYEDEKISRLRVKDIDKLSCSRLFVFLILNPSPKPYAHLEDEDFIRGNVPMTKSEIRLMAISSLGITDNSIIYDIGAGTGSVATEIALNYPCSRVIAFEKEEDAVSLIKRNKEKFDCINLEIKNQIAPYGMDEPEPCDFAFIGGSGGNLTEILDGIFGRNPKARAVITAVSLETLSLALDYIKSNGIKSYDISEISVSKVKKLGSSDMLFARNPIFIITMGG